MARDADVSIPGPGDAIRTLADLHHWLRLRTAWADHQRRVNEMDPYPDESSPEELRRRKRRRWSKSVG